jgi:LuxR family maltose regulon positive regulatory protein
VAASELTAARLAVLGAPVVARVSMAEGQYAHELALVEAEAELDAGSPAAALAILAAAAAPIIAHAQVLRARAAIQLGDVAGAAAAMRRRPVESVTVLCQVQLELVEAWLAGERHDRTRERVLVDRALRTAGRERLRTPLGWAKPWLHEVITSEPELVRRHGHFLASVNGTMQHQHVAITVLQAPVAPLTGRELDILQRLGALRTNEEIAADLFLSANTVKSHLKSLFRKLDVTRRSEAFRKGRALGLC